MRPSHPWILIGLSSLVLATCGPVGPARAEQPRPPPDAVATFDADTMALGVGYSWGSGRLSFHGHDHDFTIVGLSLVGVGAEQVEGTAEVRNLRNVEDFEGVYVLAGASGSFIILSGATAVLRNAKGVEIRVKARGQGLNIAVAAGGVRVRLG
ncbi:hypothetical protein ASD21_19415 [Caulobacter sp. Root1455]|uniref:hypothetical protein n=1 Tax=unclassified Caulobacter TaxID=2648921 RepID=UPI0006F9129A|nr:MULTISPECIES: hypothetical protein [unclassified Caulobacter]KQY28078.1 hypothetical protein ASD38_15325 [Caulobacter sp. Root487D2Y]KQZ04759.1 hypothetical protein ASD21_19415 [Caulobacter sp. Root1455]